MVWICVRMYVTLHSMYRIALVHSFTHTIKFLLTSMVCSAFSKLLEVCKVSSLCRCPLKVTENIEIRSTMVSINTVTFLYIWECLFCLFYEPLERDCCICYFKRHPITLIKSQIANSECSFYLVFFFQDWAQSSAGMTWLRSMT